MVKRKSAYSGVHCSSLMARRLLMSAYASAGRRSPQQQQPRLGGRRGLISGICSATLKMAPLAKLRGAGWESVRINRRDEVRERKGGGGPIAPLSEVLVRAV